MIVVSDSEADVCGLDATMAHDEESTEYGLGDDVQNAVEDSLGIGVDHVSAFTETPGNWV